MGSSWNSFSCLPLDDGEHQLLPELQGLTYSGSGNVNSNAFTSFIDARQNAGPPRNP
jgi:hypothetical protein